VVTEALCHALGVDGGKWGEVPRGIEGAFGEQSMQVGIEIECLTRSLHRKNERWNLSTGPQNYLHRTRCRLKEDIKKAPVIAEIDPEPPAFDESSAWSST
jgi:hypothetical protein